MPKNLMRKPLQGYFLDQAEVKAEPWKELYDSYHYSPASEMEIRRQKIACLDAILQKERHRHSDKMASFQDRWEGAAESMKAVDDSVVRFDDHYKETNVKRERFLRMAQRQDEIIESKVNDLKKLKREKMTMQTKRKTNLHRLERFKPFETYLEKVRDESQGEFRTIRELLDHFTLLSSTRAELMDREQHARNLVGYRTKQLADLGLIKSNEAVLLSNDFFEIREAYEILKYQEQRLDENLLHIQTTAAQRAMTLGQVRISTYNLYQQVCRKMNRPARIPANDTIKQLQYIQGAMKEMSKLTRQVKSILKSAHEEAEEEKKAKEKAAADSARKKFKVPRKKHRLNDMRGIFGFPPNDTQNDETGEGEITAAQAVKF